MPNKKVSYTEAFVGQHQHLHLRLMVASAIERETNTKITGQVFNNLYDNINPNFNPVVESINFGICDTSEILDL